MQYRVTVNGKIFDVVVEQVGGAFAQAPAYPQQTTAAHTVLPNPPQSIQSANSEIIAPMPGNIWDIPVSVGQNVQSGECLIVLEAMKMENEIVAPHAGIVKQILVSKSAAVETGDVLIVLS